MTMRHPQYRGRFSLNGECFFKTIMQTEDGANNLIFAVQSIVDLMTGGATIMALDATFGVVPATPPAHQLLTLHILKQTHVSINFLLFASIAALIVYPSYNFYSALMQIQI